MTVVPQPERTDDRHDTHGVASRREVKYELDLDAVEQLRQAVSRHLPCYEFQRGRPCTYITTIYFDTDRLDFYRRASASYDDNLKIRVKEYYYKADDGEAVETFPYCFVEIKRRDNGLVMKRRLRIPKRLLNRLISGDEIWEELVRADPGVEFDDSREVYGEIRRHLAVYVIRPRSIIHYRRRVYQENEAELRVTFDDQLKVYPPLLGLYDSVESLCESRLGDSSGSLAKGILEIKTQGHDPVWLEDVMHDLLPRRISKFTTSMDSVVAAYSPRVAARSPGASSVAGENGSRGGVDVVPLDESAPRPSSSRRRRR